MSKIKYQSKFLLFFLLILVFARPRLSAQMQIGFHHNVKKMKLKADGKPEKGRYYVYYIYSDTTRTAGNITGVITEIYSPDYTTQISSVDRTGAYPVTTVLNPALGICSRRLKAGLTQVDKDESGRVYINFWGITKDTGKCTLPTMINGDKKLGQFYYQVKLQKKLSDVTSYLSISYGVTEIGVTTVPFKMRFGFNRDTVMVPNDASASVNVGAYIGRKWGSSRFYADKTKSKNVAAFTLGGFVAPVVIPVKPSNSFPTTDPVRSKQLKAESSQVGMTLGAMASLSLNDFNVGLFFGIDWGLSAVSSYWYYHGRPWIGIGFGYKLSMLGEK